MTIAGGLPKGDDEPIESRRAEVGKIDPEQPLTPDDELGVDDGLPEFGEFAPESARPTPLDDIADAEREQLPRD